MNGKFILFNKAKLCSLFFDDITIVIKTIDKKHSFELLKKLNFPFKERGGN